MPRRLEDWLTAYLEFEARSEPPTLYKVWVGVSTLMAALERKCYTRWDTFIFPNEYIVLVGPPSSRKGTAMRPGSEMLQAIGIDVGCDNATRQGLIDELMDVTEALENMPPEYPCRMHSSKTIVAEELAVFTGYSQFNQEFLSQLTGWYDCGGSKHSWRYRTKARGIEVIPGPWFNLLGGTTPELMPLLFPKETIGGGLTSRVMLIYGEGKERLDHFPIKTPSEMLLLGDLVSDLRAIHELKGAFQPTEEWATTYALWYEDQEQHPPMDDPVFDGYLGRRQTHMLKLAMALSASRDDRMILDPDILQRADHMMREAERKMPMVYLGHGKQRWADMATPVLRVIKQQRDLSFNDLFLRFCRDMSQTELDILVKAMASRGFVAMRRDHGAVWVSWKGRANAPEVLGPASPGATFPPPSNESCPEPCPPEEPADGPPPKWREDADSGQIP